MSSALLGRLIVGPYAPAPFPPSGRHRYCIQPMSARFGAGLPMKGLLPSIRFRSAFRSLGFADEAFRGLITKLTQLLFGPGSTKPGAAGRGHHQSHSPLGDLRP